MVTWSKCTLCIHDPSLGPKWTDRRTPMDVGRIFSWFSLETTSSDVKIAETKKNLSITAITSTHAVNQCELVGSHLSSFSEDCPR